VVFPAVYEKGLSRLREQFDLIPIEYPTTRRMNSSLEATARDVHAAFADPRVKAIIASMGGDDQIRLLKHLDPELIRGLLQRFKAVLVARAAAWSSEHPNTAEQKARFIPDQEEAIRCALAEYHQHAVAVFNLDFGHTDPQCIIPNGGRIRIDGINGESTSRARA